MWPLYSFPDTMTDPTDFHTKRFIEGEQQITFWLWLGESFGEKSCQNARNIVPKQAGATPQIAYELMFVHLNILDSKS